jgi:hypothetical protein
MSGVIGKSGWERLRPWLPGAVVVVGLAAAVCAVIWVRAAARSSPDAWASSIEAVTTAALALITSWYAYLAFKLLDAQRSGPRVAAWETALRDLSIYLARQRAAMWTASGFFPVGQPAGAPPDLQELIASGDAIRDQYHHLLEIMGLLPTKFAKQSWESSYS